MNLKNLVILMALFFIPKDEAIAETRRTPEFSALHTVQLAMKAFVVQHNGQMPTNWSQVGTEIDLDKLNQQTLINSSIYPLQEHYVFVTDKIQMLGYQEQNRNVVLIRTEPFKQVDGESEREGRYVVSLSTNEVYFYLTWVSEANVQKMLAQAGVTKLPEPEPLIPFTNATVAPKVSNAANEVAQLSTRQFHQNRLWPHKP